MSPGTKKDRGKPRGIFSCDCGFTYARVGPDTKDEDRFTYTIVQAYGAAWEALLHKLWNDQSITVDMIARRLDICILALKRRVVALGLRFPRSTRKSNNDKGILNRYKLRRETKPAILKRKKEEWISLITANLTISRGELWASAHSLCNYLLNADPQWLKRHLPPPKQVVPRPRELDWAEVDARLAKAVADAAIKLKKSEPPIRITVEAISRLTAHSSRLRKRLDKLPRTAAILNSHLESTEDFAVRRVRWIEKVFRKEQKVPSKYAFARRAMVGPHVVSGNEVISRAVTDALSRLSSDL